MKHIVIIGSGIGGSGIGALLSTEKKHDILLLEKSHLIGGRCASYKRTDKQGREWVFDIGCHIFSTCGKGPLDEILKRCGEENMVKWVYTAPKANIMGSEDSGHKKKSEPQQQQVKEPEKELGAVEYLFRIPYEETSKYDHITLEEFFKNVSKVQPLKMNKLALSMGSYVFSGNSIGNTSAGEYIRDYTSNYLSRANGYPIGGTGAVPEAYCNIIKKNGGKVLTGKEGTVNRIRVENNQVKGVEVGPNNEFIEADIVIANSDIKTTVNKLIEEKHFTKEYLAYINGLKWAGQGCSLKLGLDKKVTDHTNLMYIPKVDLKGRNPINLEIKDMFYASEKIPELVPMLIVPISNVDPALAPDGCQTLHSVAVTKIDGIKKWSESEEKQWEKACMNTFLTLWPDLEEHIVIKEFIGPRMLEKTLGKEGAGTGIGPDINQIGDKRPSMISPIKGLCFCSGDAGGWGIGTELPARAVLQLYDIFKKNNLDIDKIWT